MGLTPYKQLEVLTNGTSFLYEKQPEIITNRTSFLYETRNDHHNTDLIRRKDT
jgi:hypothetical protein